MFPLKWRKLLHVSFPLSPPPSFFMLCHMSAAYIIVDQCCNHVHFPSSVYSFPHFSFNHFPSSVSSVLIISPVQFWSFPQFNQFDYINFPSSVLIISQVQFYSFSQLSMNLLTCCFFSYTMNKASQNSMKDKNSKTSTKAGTKVIHSQLQIKV